MTTKKYAFELSDVSIALFLQSDGLGDILVPRKILNAVVELAPNCSVDIFVKNLRHKIASKAFYGDSKNLNLILDKELFTTDIMQKYDIILRPQGTFRLCAEASDKERLKAKSPALFNSFTKINAYNEKFHKPFASSYNSVALHTAQMARVLGKNMCYFLSCDDALPIRDDGKPYIFLSSDFKQQFDDLSLNEYITIYSNITDIKIPKLKSWPMEYLTEYVDLMKKHFPNIEIVQCGGGSDVKIANADRHYLGVDLELTKHILANSLLHVGCEGGLIHLATALGTKCLTIFSYTNVYYHGYKQNINLSSNHQCSPCVHVFDHGASKSCPRGYEEPPCSRSITPQQIFQQTSDYLNSLNLKK